MKNILAIGYSSRNIVCSARRAGYNVYAIDAFCDMDLVECATGSRMIDLGDKGDIKQIDREKIIELIESFDVGFDSIVLGSGFEMMDLSHLPYPILNNGPQIMQKVSDKEIFAKKLGTLDVPHPCIYSINELGSAPYPLMVKPKYGGGGILNRVATNEDELCAIFGELSALSPQMTSDDMLIQDFISGTAASVSVISTKNEARAIAINEQLIGIPWLTELPFAYCGNITPFETPYAEKMCEMAEKLVLDFGLVGSNGVDFIISDRGPVVIEINARFQGSLDTVELATGINIFDAHMKAFGGELPDKTETFRFAARAVLYTDLDMVINRQVLDGIVKENTIDIPNDGHRAFAGDPLTSIIATGRKRQDVLRNIMNSVFRITELLDALHQ
ncbi:MAG: ATP-grasp domain-containing protein [Methanosarcinaceae archaeon]|nr:ATP-grasp domain-containing protein [Methanosarcinaceae archaeon]